MSKREEYIPPEAVDIAHDILSMHRRIIDLELENEQLRCIKKQYQESLTGSWKHAESMMGTMLGAVVDHDSALNTGLAKKGETL